MINGYQMIKKIEMAEDFYTNHYRQRMYRLEAERMAEKIRGLNKEGFREFQKRINTSIKNQHEKPLAINQSVSGTLPKLLFEKIRAEEIYSALAFAEEVSTSKILRNEHSETIDEKTIRALAQKIKKLSAPAIDELWFKSGFIYTNHGKNKAISDESIKEIKSSNESAKNYLIALFTETKIDTIKNTISALEKQKKQTTR